MAGIQVKINVTIDTDRHAADDIVAHRVKPVSHLAVALATPDVQRLTMCDMALDDLMRYLQSIARNGFGQIVVADPALVRLFFAQISDQSGVGSVFIVGAPVTRMAREAAKPAMGRQHRF